MKYEKVETKDSGGNDDVRRRLRKNEERSAADRYSRRCLGISLLLVVVVIWTCSTYLVQYIYDKDVDAPFFLTYVCNSLFVVYLPLHVWREGRITSPVGGDSSTSSAETKKTSRKSIRLCAKAALIVSPLWFLANGTYNYSLSATSAASNTIISSLSGVFTYALSLLLLSETFERLRFIGVLLSIAGATCVGIADFGSGSSNNKDDEKVWGDIVCLISSFLYASYTVAIRMYVRNEDSERDTPIEGDDDEEEKNEMEDKEPMPMMLFFGFLGTFNLVVFGAIGALLWGLRIESLAGLTFATMGMILLKASFDNVLSDYLWARAVLLTSPTVATIGLTLTIPGPLVIDTVLHGFDGSSIFRILGGLFVIAGFICVAIKPAANGPRVVHAGEEAVIASRDETSA